MKYTSILLLGYLLLTIIGCDFKRKYENKKESDDSWSTIVIVSEHRTIIKIVNGIDTLFVEDRHIGSFFAPRPKKIETDTTQAFFSKAERDSVFYLAKDIILHPILNRAHCTDYVGDLDVLIYYGNEISQQISYSGICDWNRLSDRTLKLHGLLKKRLPKIYLGERETPVSHVEN